MGSVYKYEHYNKHLTDLSLSVSMPEYLSASENMPSKVLDHKSDLFSVWDKGNAIAASIPIAMNEVLEKKERLNNGRHWLITGFGLGFAWGTFVLKYVGK